jgi:hypothetical protein
VFTTVDHNATAQRERLGNAGVKERHACTARLVCAAPDLYHWVSHACLRLLMSVLMPEPCTSLVLTSVVLTSCLEQLSRMHGDCLTCWNCVW